jgi:hypothetical protein
VKVVENVVKISLPHNFDIKKAVKFEFNQETDLYIGSVIKREKILHKLDELKKKRETYSKKLNLT